MTHAVHPELAAPFARNDLYQRHGATGKRLTYIRNAALIERLNQVYGPASWSFDVLEGQLLSSAAETLVRGRLRVAGVSITQFGSAPINREQGLTLGDTFKAAASDCLARCALLLGVGLYLRREGNSAAVDSTASETQRPASESLSQPQLSFLLRLAREQGVSESDLDEQCRTLYQTPLVKLSKQHASAFIDHLKQHLLSKTCAA